MQAGIYVRISADREGQAAGVARQEADCRKLAEERGWRVADVYSDNAISAWTGAPRAAYGRMLADIEAAKVQAVVAWKPDRLHRDPAELEPFMRLCIGRGVAVALVSGELNLATSGGKLMARVHGATDAYSSDVASERVQRAMIANGKTGKPHGGVRAYGFRDEIHDDGTFDDGTVKLRTKRTTEHDPHEVAVIREVTEALLAGASLRGQCSKLNARGDLGVQGNQWEPSPMKRMLLRPRLIGLREHRGELTPATWQAVITPEQQIELKAVLTRRHRGAQVRHLLSGVTVCGVCGAKIRYTKARTGNGATYHCPPRPRGRHCASLVADVFEPYVIAQVLRYYGEDRERLPATVTGDPTAHDRERLAAVQAAYERDALDLDEYLRFKADHQARIAETAARAAAEAEGAALAARSATLASRWPDLTDEEKRVAIQTAVKRIVLYRHDAAERVHIDWPDYQGPLTVHRTGASGLTDAELLAVGEEMQRDQRGA